MLSLKIIGGGAQFWQTLNLFLFKQSILYVRSSSALKRKSYHVEIIQLLQGRVCKKINVSSSEYIKPFVL